MADPKTLADKPVADRRGDDVLDRHMSHVIDHPDDDRGDDGEDEKPPSSREDDLDDYYTDY